MAWAGIALMARGSALKDVRPEMQMFYQVAFSIPLLVFASFFFGPFITPDADGATAALIADLRSALGSFEMSLYRQIDAFDY